MKFSWFDSGEDNDYNDIGFVELSKIFAIQGALYVETGPFERVYPT